MWPDGRAMTPADFENNFLSGHELPFLARLGAALLAGFIIGVERESRNKPAGISTHSFVIGGAAMFSMISWLIGAGDPGRIAAQIVTGVGFLGAGIIIRSEEGHVVNLTTAASIWFSAAIGMGFGFGLFAIATVATLFSVVVPRLPHMGPRNKGDR